MNLKVIRKNSRKLYSVKVKRNMFKQFYHYFFLLESTCTQQTEIEMKL